MRWLIILSLLVVAESVSAQRPATGIVYGNLIYRKNLLGQLNTFDSYSFNRPMQFIGFQSDRIPIGARSSTDETHFTNVQFVQFISSAFTVSDSVSGTLSGSSFNFTVGYDVFRKSDFFDLMFSGGVNLGRMKLIQDDLDFLDKNNNRLHLKNMFICPKAQVMLKCSFNKLNLSICSEYQLDVSGSTWKEKLFARHKPESVDVPSFNQSGLMFSVSLGISIVGSDDPYIPPLEYDEEYDEDW